MTSKEVYKKREEHQNSGWQKDQRSEITKNINGNRLISEPEGHTKDKPFKKSKPFWEGLS